MESKEEKEAAEKPETPAADAPAPLAEGIPELGTVVPKTEDAETEVEAEAAETADSSEADSAGDTAVEPAPEPDAESAADPQPDPESSSEPKPAPDQSDEKADDKSTENPVPGLKLPDNATELLNQATPKAPAKPAKKTGGDATAAIIATVGIVLILSGLAVMAYLKSPK